MDVHRGPLQQRGDIARRKEEAVPFVPPERLQVKMDDAQGESAERYDDEEDAVVDAVHRIRKRASRVQGSALREQAGRVGLVAQTRQLTVRNRYSIVRRPHPTLLEHPGR